MKIEGYGSGSISQRHGSADLDPHQNVMNPQHWLRSPALPASLEDFLGRCLWKDERDRWTAAQLLEHPFLRDAVARPLLDPPLGQEAGQARQLNNRSPSPVLGRCNPFSSMCSGLVMSREPNLLLYLSFPNP
jgi:hypothetical protein